MRAEGLRDSGYGGAVLKGLQVDCLPIMLMTLDEQGVISDVNLAWENIMGYSQQETRSRPLAEFMLMGERYAIGGADFPQGNALVRFEFPLLSKSQKLRWFSYYAHRRGQAAISGYLIDATSARRVRAMDRAITHMVARLEDSITAIDEIVDDFLSTSLSDSQVILLDSLRDRRRDLRRLAVELLREEAEFADIR